MFWVLGLSLGNLQRGKHMIDKGLEKPDHRLLCQSAHTWFLLAGHPPLLGTALGTKLTSN